MNDQPGLDIDGTFLLLTAILRSAIKDARHGDRDAVDWLDAFFRGSLFDWRCAGPRGPAQRSQHKVKHDNRSLVTNQAQPGHPTRTSAHRATKGAGAEAGIALVPAGQHSGGPPHR